VCPRHGSSLVPPESSEHLPLGVHAAEASITADRKVLDDDLTWRPVSRSADYGERYPVPFATDTAPTDVTPPQTQMSHRKGS
jgi:hypothetical protein